MAVLNLNPKKKKKTTTPKAAPLPHDGPVLWMEGDPVFDMELPERAECPLFVGFLTEIREDAMKLKPLFVSDAVKEETRQKHTAEFDAMFAAEAKNTPYLGRVKQVILTGATGRPDQVYNLMPNADKVYDINNKTTTSMTVGRKFGIWSQTLFAKNRKQVRLVGFDVRTFAKMIAFEAAESGMPLVNTDVWFAADYYDTEHILIPRSPANWATMIELRTAIFRLCSDFMPTEYIAVYKPGRHPAVDAMLSMFVCCKLRLFDEAFLEGGLTWQDAGVMLRDEIARTQKRFSAKGTKDGPRS
jgi:hypothetical protein